MSDEWQNQCSTSKGHFSAPGSAELHTHTLESKLEWSNFCYSINFFDNPHSTTILQAFQTTSCPGKRICKHGYSETPSRELTEPL